ncbi:hypothetical protein [Bosea sp. ANAM02]|uniref:hypothetical protein n=1 Tax=Bosea sp. ANAM02 TaxID=2020412 RepID=UPI00140F2DC4|nr:hypothetical protein [Bosea sp. ANAM02]BCB20737.1 hypothetical protein OCUBac02_36310 [Bosea sp. ANAM02]
MTRGPVKLPLALLAAVSVSACTATTGDLGRPRPTIWSQLVAPEAGYWSATFRGEDTSYFRLTDDEERMRDRAWRFVMPSSPNSVFQGEVSNLAHTRILPVAAQSTDVSDYFRGLTARSFASQASRYNRLAEDANADRLLIGPFRANAARVVNMDRVRMRTAEASPDVPADKQEPAQARIVENEGLVFWVCERVDFRIRSYRHALANLVVEMPSREAVKAERAIMALEMEARPLCQMQLNGAFGEGGKRPVVYKG